MAGRAGGVMPLYANTHTETSGTGRQTTRFREEARAIIKAAAKAEQAVTWLHNAAAGGVPGIDQPEALAA